FDNKITPAASSDSQVSYTKNMINNTEGEPLGNLTPALITICSVAGTDHILFGLVLGILCGVVIVLVIFRVVLVVFFRKPKVVHQPQELAVVDASTDNNTVDENQETNTETTEKLNCSQAEFNPLLVVNPVQKPPRLGIPDVSSSESISRLYWR